MSADESISKSSTSSTSSSTFLNGSQSIEDLEEIKRILSERKEYLTSVLTDLHLEAYNNKKINCPISEDANETIEEEKKKMYHCLERELEKKNYEILSSNLANLENDSFVMLNLEKRLSMEEKGQKEVVKNLSEEIKEKKSICTKLRDDIETLKLFGEKLMTSENENSEQDIEKLREAGLKVNRSFINLKKKLHSIINDYFTDETFKRAIAELYEAHEQTGEDQYVEIVNYMDVPMLAYLFQQGIIEKHPYDENKVKLTSFK